MKLQKLHHRKFRPFHPTRLSGVLLAGFLSLTLVGLSGQNKIHVRNCTEKILQLYSYNSWDPDMSRVYQWGKGTAILPQINSTTAKNSGAGETAVVECAKKSLFYPKKSSYCKIRFKCNDNTPCPEVTKMLEEGNYVYFSSMEIKKGDKCYKIGEEPKEFEASRPIRTNESILASDGTTRLLEAGRFRLEFHEKGFLCIRFLDPYSKIEYAASWCHTNADNTGSKLAFQADGNLVIYNDDGKAVWATGTADDQQGGKGGARMDLSDTGVFRVLNSDGKVIWSVQ